MGIQTLPDATNPSGSTVKMPAAPMITVLSPAEVMVRCRVFISYSHHDDELAKRLHADLSKAGYDAWIDNESLRPGTIWDEAIKTALNQTDVVLPIMTRSSAKSDFVLNEIAYALEKQKLIIPIKWDRGLRRPDDWPLNLIRLHFMDFTIEDVEAALVKLIQELSRITPDPDDDPPPTSTSTFRPLDIPTDTAGEAKDVYHVNEGSDDRQNDLGSILIVDVLIPDDLSEPVKLYFVLYSSQGSNRNANGHADSYRCFDEYLDDDRARGAVRDIQPIIEAYNRGNSFTGGRHWGMAAHTYSHKKRSATDNNHDTDFPLREWLSDSDHLKQPDDVQSLIHRIESIVDRAFRAGEVSEYEARLCLNRK